MKRFFLGLLAVICMATVSFAQGEKSLKEASKSLNKFTSDFSNRAALEEAKMHIEEAFKDEEVSSSAKSWNTRGDIYASITDAQIKTIKDLPIWFIHSKDDGVTVADQTVIPVYERLISAGAKNVHLSLYDHVVDITGFYGGENYHYSGHWSWIYGHANQCKLDYGGRPVMVEGRPVTIMEWLATQSK